MIRKRILAAILVPAFAAFPHAPAAEPDGVDAYLQDQMQKRDIPGLQVAVVRHGKIIKLGAYGLANVQDSVPVDDRTLFQVNSITKAFTGVAVMELAEAGKLDLSAPVSRYLDGLPQAWHAVTVRQLLTHVSGIPDIWDRQARLIADGEQASWAKLQTLPMEFAPGQRFRYNQANYVLLGKVIDKLSGRPFSHFIKERQFDVAGMPASGFYDSHDVVVHSARVYRRAAGEGRRKGELVCVFDDFPPFLRTAAGINTTAEGIARWVIALQEGKILKHKSSLATLWTPGVLNDGSCGGFGEALPGYALGWPMTLPPEERAVGGIGGGRSAFFVYPDHDLAVVILTNLQGASPHLLAFEVARQYVGSLSPSDVFGLPPAMKALRAELAKRGFDHAVETARELEKKGPQFRPAELDLNAWGYLLLQQEQRREAIEVFKLAVSLYPGSANTYDSLAEAYEINGDRELAIKNYKRSLELNPKNANAVEHLKGLGQGGAGPKRSGQRE
jgi:CubicO group peptidase (beta-lactamase class C family)